MFKKTLATAVLVCTVPAMASAAWFFSTQVKSAGGSLTSSNGTQIVTDGTVFKSYSVAREQNISYTVGAGNTLRDFVLVDNVALEGGGFSNITTHPANNSTFTPVDGHTYNLSASFMVDQLAVDAVINNGGNVTPTALGNIYYGYTLANPLVFSFTPKFGYQIDSINNPAGTTLALPGGVNQRATVTFPAGYRFTSAVHLSAATSSTVPAINRISPKTVAFGETVSLTAVTANLGTPTFAWDYLSGPVNTVSFRTYTTVASNGHKDTKVDTNVVAGPAVALTGADTATVSFTAPSTAGQYKFRVTAGGLSQIATVNVVATAADSSTQCQFCHTANGIADPNLGANYRASIHGQSTHSACVSCHSEVGTGAGHPGSVTAATVDKANFTVRAGATVTGGYGRTVTGGQIFCTTCHQGAYAIPHATTGLPTSCAGCHTPSATTGDAHSIGATGCIGCHAQARNAGPSFVQDNNGVRAITGEFSKWSHHVTGVAINDAHCAACHLEGQVSADDSKIEVSALHMSDNKVHLRDTTNDADEDFAWDPANPNHTGMDNFCMSCHDSNGAVSTESARIQAYINAQGLAATGKTASASNPFGDTISNRYDKMERPAVVDAKGQFATTNPSHHAVRGQKYSGRTRLAGDPRVVKEVSATFDANSSAALPGKRATIYDTTVTVSNPVGAGTLTVSKFAADYLTLSPAPGTSDRTLGDDSVLHCGDCHTVGQYRLADVGVASKNNAVIGAHGSNNEYLLRNFAGTDERHAGQAYSSSTGKVNTFTDKNGAPVTAATIGNQPWLVCFNCHSYQSYGSIGSATGATGQNHAGEYANANRCNGPVNTIPFAGYTTGTATDGEQYVSRLGEFSRDGVVTGVTSTSDTDFSNIFGIQCANCHNAGPNNGFGGIHGAKVTTYTDANGAAQNAYRFLPGLGNTMFVPGNASGLATGIGSVSDLNWEVKSIGTAYNAAKDAVIDNGGCYTLVPNSDEGLNLTTNASYTVSPTSGQTNSAGQTLFGTWGGCDDHRGNAHGSAFADTTAPYANGNGIPTGGAGVTRKVQRPVSY